MAKVNVSGEDVELTLRMAEYRWERLPEVERKIDDWDLIEQLTFIEEWPLEEMRLERLERYASEGILSKEQLARYEKLKDIVSRNRPIIRRLQNS